MRVLISGYYGFGNAGDEAVLSGMLHALAPYGVEATVISGDPRETETLHNVPAVGRGDWRRIVHRLRRTDLFISGGGGLIQDRTSRRSPLYYLGMIELAKGLGVPTYVYGQGVGPIRSIAIRRATRFVFSHAGGIGVRDDASAASLAALGVPGEKVEVTADPAFALPDVREEEARETLTAAGVDGRGPLVGLVWRPPQTVDSGRIAAEGSEGSIDLAGAVAAAAAQWAGERGAGVVVLPMHPAIDRRESEAIAERLLRQGLKRVHLVPQGVDFRALRAIIARLDLVCSVRYHGLLFAASGAVPCLAVAYDPKVAALALDLGVEALPLSAGEAEVHAAMERASSCAGVMRARLADRVAALRKRALGEARRCAALCVRSGPG